jgi:type II restriction enzyme
VPKANCTGAIGEILSTPLIGYTEAFIGVGEFETKLEVGAALHTTYTLDTPPIKPQ